MNICSIKECEKPVKARGWCNMHYQRYWKWRDPLAVMRKAGEKAWAFILVWSRDPETGCWNVISHRPNDGGYPRIRRNKKLYRASRHVFEMVYGGIPRNLCVLHSCDNRMCVNPEHLFLGTRTDNQEDMKRKGRAYNGRGKRKIA